MTRLTNSLLRRTHLAAVRHNALTAQITEAFEERYGCTYSAVDEDCIIDSLDYGSGNTVTIEECDRLMAEAGHPALTSHQGKSP